MQSKSNRRDLRLTAGAQAHILKKDQIIDKDRQVLILTLTSSRSPVFSLKLCQSQSHLETTFSLICTLMTSLVLRRQPLRTARSTPTLSFSARWRKVRRRTIRETVAPNATRYTSIPSVLVYRSVLRRSSERRLDALRLILTSRAGHRAHCRMIMVDSLVP